MTTLTELLLRDPEHPEVRALLELRYRQVCAERDLIAKLLHLRPKGDGPYVGKTTYVAAPRGKDEQR